MENGVLWKRRVPFLSLRDGGNTVAVGEAIQTGEALTLDCFAPLAMTRGSLAMTGGAPLGRMENGELKMENGVLWKRRVPFLSLRDGGNTVAVGEAIQTGKALWGEKRFAVI